MKFRNGDKILFDELPQVEAYMGLFELCYEMLQEELIDWPIFCRLYEYRIDNIMNNSDVVKAKLIDAEDGWKSFIALITRLGYIKEGNTYIKKVG